MKIAVSSYSYQQYIRAGKMTQLDVVEKAAEMGFEGIDFTDLTPFSNATQRDQLAYAEQIRRAAERVGIQVVAYTVGANLYRGSAEEDNKEVERLKGQLEVAAALGAGIMRHDVCYSEKVGDRTVGFCRMLPVIAENARKVTEYAQTLGIRTCSENHGYVAQDSDRMEKLFGTVGHENYGLLIDIGNFACVDEDPVRAVSRLAPYAIHVHAKDFYIHPFAERPDGGNGFFASRGCNYLAGVAIGEGNIPVAQCIAVLKRAKYDAFLTIEYEGKEDCIAGISRGLQNLREYLK